MIHRTFVLILFALKFHNTSQQHLNFINALENDLDVDCIKKQGYVFKLVPELYRRCISNKVIPVMRKIPELVELVCKTNVINNCAENFTNAIFPCLPKEDHETVNQYLEIDEKLNILRCESEGANLVILQNKMCEPTSLCYLEKQQNPKTEHLKDVFDAEHCERYFKYYQCLRKTGDECPERKSMVEQWYKSTIRLSPCLFKEE